MAWIHFDSLKVELYDHGKGNFTLWQTRVKDILVQQGVDRALKGKEGKPENITGDDWKNIEAKCVSTIRLLLSDNVLIRVMRQDSAQGLWEKLEELYIRRRCSSARLYLKLRLFKLKMEEGGNLIQHLEVFRGILEQLEEIGVEIEEEHKAHLLLISLSESYKYLISKFTCGRTTVNMDEDKVESFLRSQDSQSKKKSANKGDRGSGLVFHGRNNRVEKYFL